MNRNHFALFLSVARAGSISGGALAARVSQPAVSKQVSALEDELGVKLLHRLPRGCRLTEAGELLAAQGRRWLSIEEEAERAVAQWRGLQRGRLAIGASQTIGAYLLPRMLADFHRKHPEIELVVRTENTEKIEDALKNGAIELGLTEGAAEAEELHSEKFFEDELVGVAPAGHVLIDKGAIKAKEFCREPMILREVGSGTRAIFDRALTKKGLSCRPVLELSSPEAIKQAVSCGMGVAILSRLVVEAEVRAGTLGVVPITDLPLKRSLHRQHLKGLIPSPAVKAFLSQLKSWASSSARP